MVTQLFNYGDFQKNFCEYSFNYTNKFVFDYLIYVEMEEIARNDLLNEELKSISIPTSPVQKIMYYFKIIQNINHYQFPPNYLDYDNPYFECTNDYNEFLSLAVSLHPQILNEKKLFVFANNESDAENVFNHQSISVNLSNQFKLIDINQSNKNEKSEVAEIPKNENTFIIKKRINFSDLLTKSLMHWSQNSNGNDILDENNEFEDEEQSTSNENICADLNSDDLANPPESVTLKTFHQLIASNEWTNYVYYEPLKYLLNTYQMTLNSKDSIRQSSIKLKRNVFFYLTILMLVIIFCCSIPLSVLASGFMDNDKFLEYGGINVTEYRNKKKNNIAFSSNQENNETEIIVNRHEFNIIRISMWFTVTSAVCGFVFIIFIFYLVCRVRKENNTKANINKVGLKLCHVCTVIIFDLVIFLFSLVAEALLSYCTCTGEYEFITTTSLHCVLLNTFLIVCYILVIVFYFKK